MSRSIELQQILKKARKKGRVTSDFRDSVDNERVYKALGKPVNETSYHQIQGGAFDIADLPKKEAEKIVKELRSKNFFAYRNKSTGQIHGDIGPHASKAERRKEFKKLHKAQTEHRGSYLYGSPKTPEKKKEEEKPEQKAFFGQDPVQTLRRIKRERGERNVAANNEVSAPLDLTRPEEGDPIMGEIDRTITGTQAAVESDGSPREESTQIAEGKEIIKKDPERVKEIVRQQAEEQGIPKRALANAIEDVDKIANGESPEKGNSISSQFTKALTYFLPSIIGGIGGAIFEGGDGAIAGAENAQNLYQGYLNQSMAEEELLLKKKGKVATPRPFQQSDLVTKEGKVPAVFDPNTGAYVDSKGNQYKPEQLESGKQTRFDRGLDFKVEKESQFSGKQQEVQSGFDQVRGSIESIRSLQDMRDPVTGVVLGRFNSLAELAGAAPERFTRIKSETINMVSAFLKSRSGAQVSDKEREFLNGMMADVNVDPVTFENRITQFEEIINRNQRKDLMSIMNTQPLKRETARKALDRLNEMYPPKDPVSRNKIGPSAPGAKNAATPISDKDIDEIIANMTDEEVIEYMNGDK